jgi:hypothetical protein
MLYDLLPSRPPARPIEQSADLIAFFRSVPTAPAAAERRSRQFSAISIQTLRPVLRRPEQVRR